MWMEYHKKVAETLSALSITDAAGEAVNPDAAFGRWVDLALGLSKDGSIHFIGNGASASMASHFAADVTKNCGLRAGVFTDPALITALANDNGLENAFAIALDRYARQGDLLVAISSSGASPNIVNACEKARGLGVNLITVSAKKTDNPIRSLGALNFYVPAPSFSLAESSHAVILHHWTDRLERACKGAS
jgi:D-sedoheptulose 7-phosphate isomerase